MIFLLEKGFGTLPPENSTFRWAIKNLISASYNGRHLILMNSEDITNILKMGFLDEDDKRELNKIKYLSRQMIDYAQESGHYVSINSFQGIFFSDASPNCLDLEAFEDTSYLRESVLLCEDIRDCEFYKQIVHCIFSNDRRSRQLHVCFESVHGGGSGIPAMYKMHGDTKRIVFCIADSDRKHGNDEKDSTACKKLKAIGSKSTAKYIITPCRSIENLLPISLMARKSSAKPFFTMLVAAELHFYEEFLLFSGIKKGILRRDIRSENTAFKEYLTDDIFNLIQYQCKNTSCKKDPEYIKSLSKEEKENNSCKDSCRAVLGLDKDSLSDINTLLAEKLRGNNSSGNYAKLRSMYHAQIFTILEDFVSQMIPYGIAKKFDHAN